MVDCFGACEYNVLAKRTHVDGTAVTSAFDPTSTPGAPWGTTTTRASLVPLEPLPTQVMYTTSLKHAIFKYRFQHPGEQVSPQTLC